MNTIIEHLKNHRPLYFAIGFTLLFVLYISLVLVPFSSCYRLDVGSNSLGLAIYNTEMVQGFFQARDQAQLFCYSQFLQFWDVIFAVISTAMFGSWIIYLFKNKRLLLVTPTVLGMIADWSENFLEILMLKTYSYSGAISETLVSLGSGLNIFKLTMSGLTWLIILVGIILALKTFLTKPKLT
ncbi:hypothetical protein [Candidatus Pseudothioglobus sp. Uisw_086]|uniref:hypothetical protein n=1 Tax=Candidatus Pseudothioglobus sp. Uisw_086 TaxID=3230998 RepID=UPI003A863015